MSARHIADAEAKFKAVNISPDFCKVHGKTVPFDIFRDLSPEKATYAKQVRARGVKVLTVDSIVRGVVGDMGKGVFSGVSQGKGDVVVIEGVDNLRAHGRLVTRHRSLCIMNVKVG